MKVTMTFGQWAKVAIDMPQDSSVANKIWDEFSKTPMPSDNFEVEIPEDEVEVFEIAYAVAFGKEYVETK